MRNELDCEIEFYKIQETLRLHKKTKSLLIKKTEYKPDYGLYHDIMRLVLDSDPAGINWIKNGPNMRIALGNNKHNYFDMAQYEYQSDRIVFPISYHQVFIYVSFNYDEFFNYIVNNCSKTFIDNYLLKRIINDYCWNLREKILEEYPKKKVTQKDFLLPYDCLTHEEIMLRFTQIMANYMKYKVMGKLKIRKKSNSI